jgi:hypothetical protein
LRRFGATVLGIADEAYDLLRPELRHALNEYYRVTDMHDYDQLVRALGYFTHRYGKLDRIDSHNEYWLETEARLRTDFNMDGPRAENVNRIKRKSEMKKIFIKAGVDVARGKVIRYPADAHEFIAQVGYPVVAKPDIGVGGAGTYKIESELDLEAFLYSKPNIDYFMEEYILGTIQTFDGLTDQRGRIVFFTSHQYSQGIMETVNQDDDIYYYSLRDIPKDLEDAGRRIVRAFGLKERFFHFEFFRTPDNRIVALEVNMRPPGGLTTDMFNFANDIDVYREWANIVVNNRFEASATRPYHCCYIGRKQNKTYLLSNEQVFQRYGNLVVHHEVISGVFSQALGNYGFLIRSPNLDETIQVSEEIKRKA